MNVLKKVTKEAIAAVKADATARYHERLEGFAEDLTATPDANLNYPRKFLRGAIVEFTTQFVDPLLKFVIEKVSAGWKLGPVPTHYTATVFTTYLIKPDAEIEADLKLEHEEAEAKLKSDIEKENEVIIATQVALRKATVLRQREEAARKADLQLEADLEAEVRAALGAK